MHPILIHQRAVGPTELAIPSHQVPARRVIDADAHARLTDAYTLLCNHLDEPLSLLIGWLAVLVAHFTRVDNPLQGCAMPDTGGPAHLFLALRNLLDRICSLTIQGLIAGLYGRATLIFDGS